MGQEGVILKLGQFIEYYHVTTIQVGITCKKILF